MASSIALRYSEPGKSMPAEPGGRPCPMILPAVPYNRTAAQKAACISNRRVLGAGVPLLFPDSAVVMALLCPRMADQSKG